MNIDNDIKLDYDDVLLVPQRSKHPSRKTVVLEREFKFYHSPRVWQGIPIVVSNLDSTGTFAMADALTKYKVITCLHKFYKIDDVASYFNNRNGIRLPNSDNVRDYVWLSLGMREGDLERTIEIASKVGFQPNLVCDISNGYSERYISYLQNVRKNFPESIIMAGNICTDEMVPEYILHGGVDIVKVGIGPGSLCKTRTVTGCGYPQLSAIDSCSHKAHGLYSDKGRLGLICADGGCKNAGDVAKSFAANADFSMLGGLFCGIDECEGEWIYNKEPISQNSAFGYFKQELKCHGMSSLEAMKQHHGGMADYKASEGETKIVPYKGKAATTLQEILGGIRSTCSFIGASSIKEMSRCAKFIRVNRIK